MPYIELLSASEADFRKTVEEIEAHPLFAELRALGVVRRRGGRGRMPLERYEERLDAFVAQFVKRYGLDRYPDALERIQRALPTEGIASVARRLGAPTAEVRRLARFLEPPPAADHQFLAQQKLPEEFPDLDEFVSATPPVDLSQATALVQDFIQRHSLKQHQLIADFLYGDDPPEVLARRYRTTEENIRRVLDAVRLVLTTDIVGSPPAASSQVRGRPTKESPPIVARVRLEDGEPILCLASEGGYGLRYVINPAGLEQLGDPEVRKQAEELITLLRHINQRRSVQARVTAAIFERQRRYFASGDELDLMPLGQAEIARELGEHQSTVSRAVRNRYLETPYGVHELQYYCQRKRDVVLRLCAAHPGATDRMLQDILAKRYGCSIARRTVAYHRNALRRQRDPSVHAPRA